MAKCYVALALLVALVVSVFANGAPSAQAAASHPEGWTGWDCHWDLLVYVSNGELQGRGCTEWTDDSSYLWAVWSDSYAPQSYSVYTNAYGFDRCGTNPFRYDMSASDTVYNTNYGTSNSATGYYQDCTNGHNYMNGNGHLVQATSSSPQEGGTGSWTY